MKLSDRVLGVLAEPLTESEIDRRTRGNADMVAHRLDIVETLESLVIGCYIKGPDADGLYRRSTRQEREAWMRAA